MPLYQELAPTTNGVDRYDQLQEEIDEYYSQLTDLHSLPPTEVFQRLSSMAARVAEIRNFLVRQEARRPTALRTKCVDPLLEQIEFQFRLHSRIHSVRDMEFRLSGGQV